MTDITNPYWAEYKDDKMTWKDIKVIVTGADSLLAMKSKKELIEMGEEGYYTAILKEYELFKKDGLI